MKKVLFIITGLFLLWYFFNIGTLIQWQYDM